MTQSRLLVEDLSVRYGGVRAVTDVSFGIGAGELVGLIGPNGAGKTSLIDAVTGYTSCTGTVTLDGVRLNALSPTKRALLGLRRSFQTAELFDDLTVRETLDLAATPRALSSGFAQLFGKRRSEAPGVQPALDLLGIESMADMYVESLTQGQRKLVDVARALAAQPGAVCLDEPAAGLDTQESKELGDRLRRVAEGGTSVLLVDHDMGLVLGVCDRVVVIEFGELIAIGTPEEVRTNPRVVEAYLGSAAAESSTAELEEVGHVAKEADK